MAVLCTVLAVAAFAVLGITYKLSDKLKCNKQHVNLLMFASAGAAMLIWGLLSGHVISPKPALILGLCMGLVCYGAVVAFRHAASLGRISTSWTVINLALILPVIASVLIWREMPSLKDTMGLGFTLVAIILIGIDIGRAGE